MTKVIKWLGGAGLVAALGILMLGLSGSFTATGVRAESPPNPPGRFVGSVVVDGQPAAAGTVIEARIGSASCGVDTVFTQGTESRYAIDVPALDPGATPNCGTDGATVTFYIGGKLARETGSWRNFDINIVNLSYVSPTPTPTPSASASPSATPATPTTAGGGGGGAAPTPKAPNSGNGSQSGDSSAMWLFALLGAGVLAFGVGGTAVARRGR